MTDLPDWIAQTPIVPRGQQAPAARLLGVDVVGSDASCGAFARMAACAEGMTAVGHRLTQNGRATRVDVWFQ